MLPNSHNPEPRFTPAHEDARDRELALWLGVTLASAVGNNGDYLVVLRDGTQLPFQTAFYEPGSRFIVLQPRLPIPEDPLSFALQQKLGHPCVRGVQIPVADILFTVIAPDGIY